MDAGIISDKGVTGKNPRSIMGDIGIGQHKSINDYVESKLNTFAQRGLTMETLFSLVFREEANVMYERSTGYRIESFTYGEVKKEILRKCTTLDKLLCDVPKGSVVGLAMGNSLNWIENFWAIIITGYRPLPVNLRLPQEMAEGALCDCDARAVISDERSYSLPMVKAQEIVAADREYAPIKFGEEILVMTSGTTRHVKLCAFSAEELYHQIKGSLSIIKECPQAKKHYNDRLKLLTFLPFYHVFGLVAVYIWFSFFSRTFVELKDMSPDTILGTVKRHQVTHIFAVPLFWEKVYEQADKTIRLRSEETYNKFNKVMRLRDKLGDSALGKLFSHAAFKEVRENLFGESIRFMITGGSMISTAAMRFFNGIGYHLADGYGMSEIGITSLELSDKPSILNSGFIGKPMDGMEYRIDENGELLVKGQAVARYIIEDGERKMIKGDYFATHDLAECQDGHYRVLGRRDDLVIGASGENLNPNLIELALKVDDVNEVCLLGAEIDGKTIPTLVISVNRFISREKLDSLDRSIKHKLDQMHLSTEIHKILYVSDRLIIGDEYKLNRLRLKSMLEEGGFTPISPIDGDEALQDDLAQRIREFFAQALGKETSDIPDKADFFLDLGGSSLDYFGMTAGMENEFEIRIPMEQSEQLVSVREFYEFLKQKM